MAIYDYLQPLTQVADLPQFQTPTWFRKRNGDSTFLGDAIKTAVPVLTTIASTALGGPLGSAAGQALGQGIVAGMNRRDAKVARLQGATDALNTIEEDLAPEMARSGLLSNLASLVSITPAREGLPTDRLNQLQSVNPTPDNGALNTGILDMSSLQEGKNQLMNSFSTAGPSTSAKINLLKPTGDILPTAVQQALIGFSRQLQRGGNRGSSYQIFAEGGLPQSQTDYRRYLDSDKVSEDLISFDIRTGRPVHLSRYGERIYDQKATDTIDKAIKMLQMKPSQQGFAGLGRFIFNETLTHSDQKPQPNQSTPLLDKLLPYRQPLPSLASNERPIRSILDTPLMDQSQLPSQSFAEGGKFLLQPWASDPPAFRGISLDEAFQRAKASRSPLFSLDGKMYRAIDLDPMAGRWATPPAPPTSPTVQSELDRYRQSSYYQSRNQPTPVPTPAPAPVTVTGLTPQVSNRLNSERPMPTRRFVATPPVAANTTPQTGIYTVQAGDTLNEIVAKVGGIRPDIMRWNAIANPDKIQAGQVLNLQDPRTGIPTPNPISRRPTNPFANALSPSRVNPIKPIPVTISPPQPNYNWLTPGNIADAARAFVGYSQASRPLPENPINLDYLKLLADAKVQQSQGLGPAGRQLFNSQINDSRSLGIDAIRRTAGGGGNAASVLGALGQVNDATSNAALKLATADEQARQSNQNRYQSLLGGLMDQQQQRFGMAYNAALMNKQAGLNLAQQGLQSIQDRYDFYKAYQDPASPYARLYSILGKNEATDSQATRSNYETIGRRLGGKAS
ncbi:LysM peptidoglycan-binding domain-containing protein [uncultured Spirosoma sp.]|uniref:LysM peptidoglycan-binding domain-containing protein n=1 Tax=uncultured Spirosoma sp. TaxID=278208 RepID=UPI00260319EA|nr:LysM peptidoglycan-binding domain-containing protein [uncultured Spirosoma sp.]